MDKILEIKKQLLYDDNYNLKFNLNKIKEIFNIVLEEEATKVLQEVEYEIIKDEITIDNKDHAKQFIKLANTNKKVLEYLLSIDEYFILEITNQEFLNDKKMLLKNVLLEDWILLTEVGAEVKNDPEIIKTILVHFSDENYSDDYRLDFFIDLVTYPDLEKPIVGKELKKKIVKFMNGLDYDNISLEIAQIYKEKNDEILEFFDNLIIEQNLKEKLEKFSNMEEWNNNEDKEVDEFISKLIKISINNHTIDDALEFLLINDIHLENLTETWIEIIRPILAKELEISEKEVDKIYYNKYFFPEVDFDNLER